MTTTLNPTDLLDALVADITSELEEAVARQANTLDSVEHSYQQGIATGLRVAYDLVTAAQDRWRRLAGVNVD